MQHERAEHMTSPLISETTCIETLQIKPQQLNKNYLFIQQTHSFRPLRLQYAGDIWWDIVNLNVCWGGFVLREKLNRVLRYFCLMSEFTLAAYIHNKMINDEKQKSKGPHDSSHSSYFKTHFKILSLLLQTKHKCKNWRKKNRQKIRHQLHIYELLFWFSHWFP